MSNHLNKDLPHYEPQPLEGEIGKLFDSYDDEFKKNGNMLVKIQVGINPFSTSAGSGPPVDYNRKLAVYNKTKSFRCFLDPHKLDGQELIAIIDKRGIGKGYFWAFMERGQQQLTVITDPVHRAQ